MPEDSQLEQDRIHTQYASALAAGRLTLQLCACGHFRLPPSAACPACLGNSWTWQAAQGGARLKSWVVYHVAFHPDFRDRLPYNVALVELDEGPRMITNILADNAVLQPELRLRFVAPKPGESALARFELFA
jgi:uncharacterized OB-fold protein